MRIVLATSNKGKIAEISEFLAPLDLELVTAEQMGVTDFPPEDGDSYEANALIKAQYITKKQICQP